MKTLSQLSEQIIETWAKPKGLCDRTQAQALAQHSKTEEEVGELLHEIQGHEQWSPIMRPEELKASRDRIKLEAGDVLVTLVIQSEIHGHSMEDLISPVIKSQSQSEFPVSFYVRALKGWIIAEAANMIRLEIALTAIAIETLIKPYDLTLVECLAAAWEKIRDRTGKTINGVFIKSEDLL